MHPRISITEIIEKLHCTVLYRGAKESVTAVVASGLMSDVLTTDKDEILLVSNLSSSQVLRTADMVDANAVLVTNGKKMSDDTLALAAELDITLLSTDLPLFEACRSLGRIIDGL